MTQTAIYAIKSSNEHARRSTLTRIDINGQPLLRLGRAPGAEYQPRHPGRHVAQHVAARRPFRAEGAAAAHLGLVDAEDDGEVVVAACVRSKITFDQ